MRTIVAIALLIIILFFGISEQFYYRRVFGELEARMELVNLAAQEGDAELALSITKDTVKWWDKKLKFMEAFVPHLVLSEVTLRLNEAEGLLTSGDTEQTVSTCYVLLGLCESIPHQLGFHIQHIF
jgi:hypothetical protein